MKWLSDKLNFKKLRLYKVLKKIELINFELELSRNNRVYLVFYVALLKLISQNIFLAKIMDVKEYEDQKYIIKSILMKRKVNE